MNKTAFGFFFCLLITALFAACTDPFEEKVTMLAQDGSIDKSDLLELEAYVENDRRLSRSLRTPEEILEKVSRIIEDNNIGASISIENEPVDSTSNPEKATFNVYLENSGSMFGYINGRTELEEALMGFWTEVTKRREELNINFINDDIYPIEKEFGEFFEYLQPNSVRNIGQTKSSNIAKILDMVIKEYIAKEEPAVLLSDFIFSLEKGGDILDQLSIQKYGIKSIIIKNELAKKGYGIMVIKLNSVFDGTYYDFENKPTVLKNKKRPYYIWVIDKVGRLKKFPERYNIQDLNGYENHTLLYSSESSGRDTYCSILRYTNKKGSFQRTDRDSKTIDGIKEIKSDRREEVFQFSLVADLSGVPVSEDYIQDIGNYELESSVNNAFDIVSVEPLKIGINTDKKDESLIGNATHLITLQTEKVNSGKQSLSISLMKKLPRWVEASSILNDKDTSAIVGKTFGFQYLIEGVDEAFEPLDHSAEKYFTTTFTLER